MTTCTHVDALPKKEGRMQRQNATLQWQGTQKEKAERRAREGQRTLSTKEGGTKAEGGKSSCIKGRLSKDEAK